jgi:glucose-6-phosphate 1-epimerase
VEDIAATSIAGLKGLSYLDKVADFAKKTEAEEAIKISSEVDRVYLDATGTVDIRDARLGRTIRVEKTHSASTVVWNPWIAKSQQMPDFGNDEYQNMVCVESGNVNVNKVMLDPGEISTMKVKLSTQTL